MSSTVCSMLYAPHNEHGRVEGERELLLFEDQCELPTQVLVVFTCQGLGETGNKAAFVRRGEQHMFASLCRNWVWLRKKIGLALSYHVMLCISSHMITMICYQSYNFRLAQKTCLIFFLFRLWRLLPLRAQTELHSRGIPHLLCAFLHTWDQNESIGY